MKLVVDGKEYSVDVDPDMPLLWVLRDEIGVTGQKFGCGVSVCGACTVHIDGQAVRSCQIAVSEVDGDVATIARETATPVLKAVQDAWIEHQVAQCGYCQGGQMMQAADFLERGSDITDETIDAAMSSNLCRCGTYPRIREAVKTAAAKLEV